MTTEPKPRRKLQPTAQEMRDKLALAATEIIDLRTRYTGWPQTRNRLIACGAGIVVGLGAWWIL